MPHVSIPAVRSKFQIESAALYTYFACVNVLLEFLLRLVAGITAAMAVTSAGHVSSGFFRNHLYVVLGLATLACLVAASLEPLLLWETVPLAVLAYAGAIAWLYDAKRTGKVLLWLICGGSLLVASQAAVAILPQSLENQWLGEAVNVLDVATSSWLLGAILVSMLLGHWYLNAPEMEIAPLYRLLVFAYAGLFARALLCGSVLVWGPGVPSGAEPVVLWLVVLRWLFGLIGLAGVLWMTWQTLKIPNTQSATGLLYVAVFAVLAGELVSLLLSAQYAFAL